MIRILCLTFALLGLSFGAALADGPQTLILAHGARQNPFAVPMAALAWKFRESLEQVGERQIRVQIVPESQAGTDTALVELVRKGIISSAVVSASALVSQYPPLLVSLLPFATDSRDQAARLLDGPFGQAMIQDMEQRTGLSVLALPPIDSLHVLTSQRRPILTVDDAQGLPMATLADADLTRDMLDGLGMEPAILPLRQIFSRLDDGQADGFVGSADQVLALHLDDVQSFVTVSQHRIAPYVWLFHRDTLAAMNEGQQSALRAAARTAVQSALHLAQRLDQEQVSSAKLGRVLEIHTLSAEQRAGFRQHLDPLMEKALQVRLGDADHTWLTRLRQSVPGGHTAP